MLYSTVKPTVLHGNSSNWFHVKFKEAISCYFATFYKAKKRLKWISKLMFQFCYCRLQLFRHWIFFLSSVTTHYKDVYEVFMFSCINKKSLTLQELFLHQKRAPSNDHCTEKYFKKVRFRAHIWWQSNWIAMLSDFFRFCLIKVARLDFFRGIPPKFEH